LFLLGALIGCAQTSEPTAEVAPEPAPESEPVTITVLAAASLTDVLPKVGELWTAVTGQHATFVFDASSRLAKQIEAGAPADVFISADEEWMDWAAERSLVRTDTRKDLLGNSLVAVVPAGASFVPGSAAELVDPRIAHLALAGESVPAGKYARTTLGTLGVWDGVSARVVDGDSVRTALGWVARGEAEAGIVYGTDARVEPGVQVAFAFPPDSHPPIVYPGAVVKAAQHPEQAAAFLEFLPKGGKDVLRDAGFAVLP
jgi:molybdate transport system substrate-binding protein